MWQDFANTLNDLNKAYKALIELGKKKRNALIMVDMKTVENLLPQGGKTHSRDCPAGKKSAEHFAQNGCHKRKTGTRVENGRYFKPCPRRKAA